MKNKLFLIIIILLFVNIVSCLVEPGPSAFKDTNPDVTPLTPINDPNIFSIYSETYTHNPVLMSLWAFDNHVDRTNGEDIILTTTLSAVYSNKVVTTNNFDPNYPVAEGLMSLKAVATGLESWHGFGWEFNVDQDSAVTNMSEFSNGHLHFFAKAPVGSTLYVGIKERLEPAQHESWLDSTDLEDYGYTNDGQWHEVRIPLTNFPVNTAPGPTQYFGKFTNINFFALFRCTTVAAGHTFYIDNLYWSKLPATNN